MYGGAATTKHGRRDALAKRRKQQSLVESTHKLCLGDLDDNLLLEVLLRLPTAKHALICSSVCKKWYRLILNDFFIGRFVSYHMDHDVNYNCNISIEDPDYSHEALLLCENPKFQIKKLDSSSFCEESEWVRMLSTCHDLVLCVARMKMEEEEGSVARMKEEEEEFRYFICNFLTKQKTDLPAPAEWLKDMPFPDDITCAFICKPYCARDAQGRCTPNPGYHYRALRFLRRERSDAWGLPVEMYCSETGQWSRFCLVDKELQEDVHSSLVWYKEKLHWSTKTHIVAFDPFSTREVCFSVKHPKIRVGIVHEGPKWCNSHGIGVCRGLLRFMEMGCGSCRHGEDPDLTTAYLRVWNLEDYENKEWGLERTVRLYKLAAKNDSVFELFKSCNLRQLRLLEPHPFNEDVVYLSFDETVVTCNIKAEELKVLARGKLLAYKSAGKLITIPWWPTPITPILQNSQHSVAGEELVLMRDMMKRQEQFSRSMMTKFDEQNAILTNLLQEQKQTAELNRRLISLLLKRSPPPPQP